MKTREASQSIQKRFEKACKCDLHSVNKSKLHDIKYKKMLTEKAKVANTKRCLY